jgi:Holliday junction resolvase RusA-like endonuclease
MMNFKAEITLTLPLPPSANKYWVYTGRSVVTSPEAKAYKEAIRLLVRCEMLLGRVAVNISVFRRAKRGDLDNYQKILLDSLEGILYENDDQITEIHAYRYDDPENPRVELVAYEDADD